MLKKVLLALAVLLVVFLGAVATRPATFKVERSTTVSAPAEVVYAHVADFHKMKAWSPFMKPDPARTDTFAGTPAAVGHSVAWTSEGKSHEGRMTIVSTRPPEQLDLELQFLQPFEATNGTVFRFAQAGRSTTVTWTMTGHNGFLGKTMSLFMDMDKVVGPDFERGLAQLKALSEAEAAAQAAAAVAGDVAP